jgi:hypothetical protein
MDKAEPHILFSDAQPRYVMVSIAALRNALFEGMDRFLIDVYKNPNSKEAKLADKRFESFVHKMKTEDVISTRETS